MCTISQRHRNIVNGHREDVSSCLYCPFSPLYWESLTAFWKLKLGCCITCDCSQSSYLSPLASLPICKNKRIIFNFEIHFNLSGSSDTIINTFWSVAKSKLGQGFLLPWGILVSEHPKQWEKRKESTSLLHYKPLHLRTQ